MGKYTDKDKLCPLRTVYND